MSSMPPTSVGGSSADSEDPWAKAFKSLSEEDRKEFADTSSDMRETLKTVSIVIPAVKSGIDHRNCSHPYPDYRPITSNPYGSN
jgi:hypothetical protein